MPSIFSNVPKVPTLELLKVQQRYEADKFEGKVNLGRGVYLDDNGKVWVLPVVRKVETILAADESITKEYGPPFGYTNFTDPATKLLLGENSPALLEDRAFGIQTLGGSGALRVAGEFLKHFLGFTAIYFPNPNYGNHTVTFKSSGFSNQKEYRYWSRSQRGLDLGSLLEDLENAPDRSLILLHACAHNPTGCDPTRDQWKLIADVIERKKHFPLFDCAYQGFASGDLDEDAWSVRYFVGRGLELICAQSFSKSVGIYSERVANLVFVLNDGAKIPDIKSNLLPVLRGLYTVPADHGSRIVSKILNDPVLFEEWKQDLRVMASRIKQMRASLKSNLDKLGTPGNWDHVMTQIGMFCYSGLKRHHVEYLAEKYHIYFLNSGRICISCLTSSNVEHVAHAIHDAVLQFI